MTRTPDEESDLLLVDSLVFAPRGLSVKRFSHAETVRSRTPDFRILQLDEVVAFCEVKSPRDEWLDEKLVDSKPGELVGGLRPDPVFNRIARHVEKAATQFQAVNSDRKLPNILILVNHDRMSRYSDLVEVLTGEIHTNDGEKLDTMKYISEGRLRIPKHMIDLYVWLDVSTKKTKPFHGASKPDNVKKAMNLLGFTHKLPF